MKFEFDDIDEYRKAMKHLSEYHDCEKCQGKIVMIGLDEFGNTTCGYCGARVEYPRLSEKAIRKIGEGVK